MEYDKFVQPELLVLIPVLYALGLSFKQSNKIKDELIPILLTAVGVVMSGLYIFGTEGFSVLCLFSTLVQGVLVSAAAVYTNQLFKQSKKM